MNHGTTSQLKTIVVLFVVLRLTVLFFYTPQGLLNAFSDYQHFYRTAQLSDSGYFPYVNSWSEYPPLLNYTTQLAYTLTRSILPPGDLASFTYQFFARVLGLILLAFDVGVLILLQRLAQRVWGTERANWLGWVYATLSVPLFYWNTNQTSNVAFFTLLAVEWFLTGRRTRSAVAVALGIMTKFTPIFLLGAIGRWLWPTRSGLVRYGLIALLVCALIFAPFVALGGTPWIAASVSGLWARASYATPWAIIDGNGGVGVVGDVPTRTQLDLATKIYGQPARLPAGLILIAFAALYLWLFFRPIEPLDPRRFLWFSTLTLMVFHLWSKGWSPQWATLIMPFMLLSFPDRRGLTLVLLLTGSVFLEWPISDALQSNLLLTIAIISRTVVLMLTAYWTFKCLWPSRYPREVAPDAASE